MHPFFMNIVYCLIPYIINHVINMVLTVRQYNILLKPQPSSTQDLASSVEFDSANSYGRDKLRFSIVQEFFNLFKNAFIIFNVYWLYSLSIKRLDKDVSLIVLISVIEELYRIPFNLYFDFVLEKRHGFNKKTIGTFFADTVKYLILLIIILTPFSYVVFSIINRFSSFYPYLWAFMSSFQIFMILIYPDFIAPLFNKFEKMEDGELSREIRKLAEKVKFGVDDLFVMDGSKRSGHSNAYFTGFGKLKKIVFYDTILQHLDQEEILAVLCHEFGHWKNYHIYKMLVVVFLKLFGFLYVFNILYNFSTEPAAIKMLTFTYLIEPIGFISGIMSNLLSRKHEKEADSYAVNMGYGDKLMSALKKLHKENKSCLVNDPWYSCANFSHPPLMERLEFIRVSMENMVKKSD